jgi:hypothetical protein
MQNKNAPWLSRPLPFFWKLSRTLKRVMALYVQKRVKKKVDDQGVGDPWSYLETIELKVKGLMMDDIF